MSIVDRLLRRKKADPDARRRWLLANGRITEGEIIDCETSSSGEEIVFYRYTLNGVDFESSDVLTAEQANSPIKYAPGAKVSVRYEPRSQGNSVIE